MLASLPLLAAPSSPIVAEPSPTPPAVLEMAADDRPLRFKRHSNYYPRVKAPTP